jgi:N-acetylneuraminic acid mutarotase
VVWLARLHDKTFIKLVVVGNTIEFRKEFNDASTNSDQRLTAFITNLQLQTVRLRLVIDPMANTAEGSYSVDGVNYLNAGARYTTKYLSISGMGLTASTAYAGIFTTYRNGTSPVTYTFEQFSVYQPSTGNAAPVFSSDNYNYSLQDNVAVGTLAGTTNATDPNGETLNYSIVSGNTNSAFSINAATGEIKVAKSLNYHTQNSYTLTIKATDAGGLSDEAAVSINVTAGTSSPAFNAITWSTAANQPYTVSEGQGEVVKGKLYTFGGFDSQKSGFTPTSRAYVFDPDANTWTPITSMPPMNGTNYGGVTHAGFTTDGTDIYFAGGYTSNSTGTGQIFGTNEVWKYIVSENRYERLPNLPLRIAAGQLEYLNGRLHHIAGTNAARTMDLGDHYVLDLDNLAAGWKSLAPLPTPRQHAGSTVFEGQIYFIGGQTGHDNNLITKKDVHRYDPATNSWTQLADIPAPTGTNGRGHISSAVINFGPNIIVIGGETSHGARTNMVSAYNPGSNAWSNSTPLPSSRHSGVAATLGSTIYYTGGSNTRTTYKGMPGMPGSQQLASFTLINADTDQPIQTLTNGSTLNLSTLPSRNLSIRANTTPAIVGSVILNLTGAESKTAIESISPYALHGDNPNGNYNAWTPRTGDYILKGTPYTGSSGSGTAGTSLTVNFTVIDQAPVTSTPTTNSLVMMYPNPSTGEDVQVSIQNLGSQEKVIMRLIDMTGRILEVKNLRTNEEGNTSTMISTRKRMQAGIYILQIQTTAGTIQKRLLVK